MAWRRQSILSAQQFTPQDLGEILELSRLLEERLRKTRNLKLLDDYVLATLFFEPSTRTRLSFEAAMHRLGGRVISTVGVQFSSLAKGETLFDTLKMVESYSDVCAIRHSVEGASTLAARSIKIPVINAGDGAGEHPTQGLLDLYTIHRRGYLEKPEFSVAFVGDIRYGRTIHSLVQYVDGSVIAELGAPDMRTPIAHALAWPERIESGVDMLDLVACGSFDFMAPDLEAFPCLRLAFEALRRGGRAPAVLNAANEVAVAAFLDGRIGFLQIPEIIETTLNAIEHSPVRSLDDVLAADADARAFATSCLTRPL